jgi:hypothetical protein
MRSIAAVKSASVTASALRRVATMAASLTSSSFPKFESYQAA